ncbi:tRNA-dependent cyclodipeptide synthase [Streptomyces sp. NPDC000927]|uniref:tRNA-dependent cyclodipeptide synthase n=1 Tax=Streptomyces sp. NPDC000927 TaxID=3154371 RepID=UPI00332EC831
MLNTVSLGGSHGMQAEALSEESERLWKMSEHALIGISAGNSYFSQHRLTSLLQWAAHHFKMTDVVYVDTHIDDMQIADGRDPREAAKSVKRTLKDVRRRIHRATESLGPEEVTRFRVRPLSEIQETPEYQAVRARVDQAVQYDAPFAAACQDMVRSVVTGRLDDEEMSDAHLRAGMNYVMAEAPLFVDSPGVFGVSTSVLCYHMLTPVTVHFTGAVTGYQAAKGQGYVVVRPGEGDERGGHDEPGGSVAA